jgi:hypothetical protein
VDLGFERLIQIREALPPLHTDLGSYRRRSLLNVGPHVLHRLFDLNPYILYLCAQCLRLVIALNFAMIVSIFCISRMLAISLPFLAICILLPDGMI